jgi:hypothetical protein
MLPQGAGVNHPRGPDDRTQPTASRLFGQHFVHRAAAPRTPGGEPAANASAAQAVEPQEVPVGPQRRSLANGGGHGLFWPLIDFRPMPTILFERLGEGGRYIVYEPPPTGVYKLMALVAVLLAAVVIGGLTAIANRKC